jgi:uncharacterized protein
MLIEAAAETDGLKAVVSEGAGIRSAQPHTPPNLKHLLGRIAPRPVLLIDADQGVSGKHLSAEYYDAGEPKLWKTDSGHTGGYAADPEEYERRIVQFFDTALA